MNYLQNNLNFGFTENNCVLQISFHEAKPFIENWHYSKIVPAGYNIFFGWIIDNEIYAVSNYGIGVNTFQSSFLAKQTGLNVNDKNLVELKRLCRKDPKKSDYPLTKFLSICHKKLKKMGYKYVVSFSDPEHNHSGGIYKASNFKHLGKTRAEIHYLNSKNEFVHRRIPRHHQKKSGMSYSDSVKYLNLQKKITQPKDRWFIQI